MIEAPPYPKEKERLSALKKLQLLDTPIEERFEAITHKVCRILDVPIALFNLIDENRQHYKSAQGMNSTTNVTLDGACCTHALHEDDMLLVPDASKDERFHDNPHVTHAEYWDINASRMVQFFEFVKANITGEQPKLGENQKFN